MQTVTLQRAEVRRRLTSTVDVKLAVNELAKLPADSNPFHYNHVASGVQLNGNWTVLFESPVPNQYLQLFNTLTGQVFQIDISSVEPDYKPVIFLGEGDQPDWPLYTLVEIQDTDKEEVAITPVSHPKFSKSIYYFMGHNVLLSFRMAVHSTRDHIREAIENEIGCEERAQIVMDRLTTLREEVIPK